MVGWIEGGAGFFLFRFCLAAPSSYRVDRGRHLASSTFAGVARVNLLDLGLARARGWGATPMLALAARCELRGGARQQSGFNNCGEGGSCGIAR